MELPTLTILRVVECVFIVFSSSNLNRAISVRKQWRLIRLSHSAGSVLGLHCVNMSHKKDAQLIWIKQNADI